MQDPKKLERSSASVFLFRKQTKKAEAMNRSSLYTLRSVNVLIINSEQISIKNI